MRGCPLESKPPVGASTSAKAQMAAAGTCASERESCSAARSTPSGVSFCLVILDLLEMVEVGVGHTRRATLPLPAVKQQHRQDNSGEDNRHARWPALE